MKAEPGQDILLSAGPTTLVPILASTGLVDELVMPVHPAVITDGPRLFDGVSADLAFTWPKRRRSRVAASCCAT
jgi:riboflavin biosynthesis pyrimidine reductase